MATHSSVLAWRIPGTGKPGGLPSMGSYRVGHDWSDLTAAAVSDVVEKVFSNLFFLPKTKVQLKSICPRAWDSAFTTNFQGMLTLVIDNIVKHVVNPLWSKLVIPIPRYPYASAQLLLRLTLCDPMDCNPPGSSVCGIFQASILEWVAMSSSRGSSQPKDQTHVSGIGKCFLYHWATWEARGYTWEGF